MFKKVLEYAGSYKKTTYASMAVMLLGIIVSVLPFLFLYQLIAPLLMHRQLELTYSTLRRLIRRPVCKRVIPLPLRGIPHTKKPTRIITEEIGKKAVGCDRRNRHWIAKKDVYRRYRFHRIAACPCPA